MSRLNVLFVLLLAGCSAPIEETHFVASWRCGPQIVFDAFQAGDALQLVFPDRRLALQPAASEDGRRYTSETAEFRENNEIAVLTLNGERHECRHDTSVMNAVERGVDYRAVGQEPGWLLEISRGEKI